VPEVSGVAPTAAATLPAALPSFFAGVVIMVSVDSSGLSFFAIEDYSSARRWAADLDRTGQTVHEFRTALQCAINWFRTEVGRLAAPARPRSSQPR